MYWRRDAIPVATPRCTSFPTAQRKSSFRLRDGVSRNRGQFVDRHLAQLAAMPMWLFSSGPLGRDYRSQRVSDRGAQRRLPRLGYQHVGWRDRRCDSDDARAPADGNELTRSAAARKLALTNYPAKRVHPQP
jgi:hypothetical protein